MPNGQRGQTAKVKRRTTWAVGSRSLAADRGQLRVETHRFACALGRNGRRAIKREGDGATPIGRWRLLEVYYRRDRVMRPRTDLPVRAIRGDDGWCDALGDRNYNRRVRHPYMASAEAMTREDPLYDIVVVLDYNIRPRVQGRGSAIFMHLAREGYAPTAGCIALSERDLRLLLQRAGRHASVMVPG